MVHGTPAHGINTVIRKGYLGLIVVIATIIVFVIFLYFYNKTIQLYFPNLYIYVFVVSIMVLISTLKDAEETFLFLYRKLTVVLIPGRDAEEKVAKVLEEIDSKSTNITVLHDLNIGNENIDHVLVYKNKLVIIIETKGWKGRWNDDKVHGQVLRQIYFLHDKLHGRFIKSFVVYTSLFIPKNDFSGNIHNVNIKYLEHEINEYIKEHSGKTPESDMNIVEELRKLQK